MYLIASSEAAAPTTEPRFVTEPSAEQRAWALMDRGEEIEGETRGGAGLMIDGLRHGLERIRLGAADCDRKRLERFIVGQFVNR